MQAVNFNADSCFTVNGTSALKAETAPRLFLIKGGRNDESTQPVSAAPFVMDSPFVLIVVLAAVALLIGAMSISLDAIRDVSFSDAICDAGTVAVDVVPGDTIWSIAEAHKPSGAQTSDVVDWIRRENNLSSSNLSIGQNLVVPNCSSL